MELVNALAESYAEKYTSPEDELLREIHVYTYTKHADPHMLSGPLQGKLLELVSRMIRPDRILEIGTFTGYSALCLAKGLTEKGILHTIELREEDSRLARGFFDRSPLGDQMIIHTGRAAEIIPSLNETWDLVFIDADKPGYIEYFNLVLPKLRKNGFILADNVFFHGQVLEDPIKGKNAIAIQSFNEYVHARKDVETAMLTIRDGLLLIRKL